MKITCVVIDDEPPAVRILEKYIGELPQLRLTASFTNALEGMNFVQTENADLLFLDINMPKLSGISLLKSLSDPPLVIFTTAYPEFAVEGFELEALDYLVKPFSFERFLKAVNKATSRIEQRERLQQMENMSSPSALFIKADRKLYSIKPGDILFLQAFGDYVRIFTREKNYMTKETLNRIEEQLPQDSFLRIHRSYIISLSAIEYVEGNHVCIGNDKIPIGQTYREELMKRFSK